MYRIFLHNEDYIIFEYFKAIIKTSEMKKKLSGLSKNQEKRNMIVRNILIMKEQLRINIKIEGKMVQNFFKKKELFIFIKGETRML
jgi:hypothetical protein